MYKKANLSVLATFLFMATLVLISYKNNALFLNQILISCSLITLIIFIRTRGNEN
ncbi:MULTISPECIES: hypothetical protein [Maribacter]|uniref:hypothetical protein n=1 Tax=Maribacter TaxID=252356 RepID=UPI0023EADDC9|nr:MULTISPECIES: hypothetical protein [Maribacter]MDF4220558.1 hypothetical protein [Maribacter huludaoensis]